MKKTIAAALAAVLCVFAGMAAPASAAGGEERLPALIDDYQNHGFKEIVLGETIDLAPLMTGDEDTGMYAAPMGKLRWTSQNPETVSVTDRGKATALKLGTSKIEVTYSTSGSELVSQTVYLTVTDGTAEESPDYSLRVNIDKEVDMEGLFFPGVEGGSFQWNVKEDFLATVDEDGMLTAVMAGSCWIVAAHTDEAGNRTVKNIWLRVTAEHHGQINQFKTTVAPGDKVDLISAVYPAPTDAARRLYTCQSDNSQVVSIDKNQNITAEKSGDCYVTILYTDRLGREVTRQAVHVVVEK